MKKDVTTTVKGIPADTYEVIKNRAERNGRSINKEIIEILKRQK